MARRRNTAAERPELAAEEALKHLDESFLECRDLRHPWAVVGYFRSNGYVSRKLVCGRCEMERIDHWTASGVREAPTYRAPEDYYIKGSHATAQDVRVEVLRRVRGTIARSENQLDASPRRARRK